MSSKSSTKGDDKSKGSPRGSRSKKDKEKKRPHFQHAVFKTKGKAKKFFAQLDTKQTKRLTKAEFVEGLRHIFDEEVRQC